MSCGHPAEILSNANIEDTACCQSTFYGVIVDPYIRTASQVTSTVQLKPSIDMKPKFRCLR